MVSHLSLTYFPHLMCMIQGATLGAQPDKPEGSRHQKELHQVKSARHQMLQLVELC